MKKLLKISVVATALTGALLAVNYQPKSTVADRLKFDCCVDPPGCPDPINPMCPPLPGGLQAK